jgi:hypothetical protein
MLSNFSLLTNTYLILNYIIFPKGLLHEETLFISLKHTRIIIIISAMN